MIEIASQGQKSSASLLLCYLVSIDGTTYSDCSFDQVEGPRHPRLERVLFRSSRGFTGLPISIGLSGEELQTFAPPAAEAQVMTWGSTRRITGTPFSHLGIHKLVTKVSVGLDTRHCASRSARQIDKEVSTGEYRWYTVGVDDDP